MHGLYATLEPAPHYSSAQDIHFGDAEREAQLALQDTVVIPLLHLGTLAAIGPDSAAFLQGQLSNDLRHLTPEHGQLSSYNSPKGRMLAVLAVYRRGEAIHLEMPRGILDAVQRRLRMFILRAKLQLEDVSPQYPAFGIAGPRAEALLQSCGLPVPAAAWECASVGHRLVLRRPGNIPRFSVHLPEADAAGFWTKLAQGAEIAGTNAWKLLEIRAGLPIVHIETQDRFVPQMANLDQLNGISFQKGCYTGQEIVARLHYLGEVKRRMYRLRAEADAVAPGTPIYDANQEGRSCGEVVECARSPGGCELLAVLQTMQIDASRLRLGASDGPVLHLPC